MPIVNSAGYLVRGKHVRVRKGEEFRRDWWFVKHFGVSSSYVSVGNVCLPLEWAGRKVRFKIEVVDEFGGVLDDEKKE